MDDVDWPETTSPLQAALRRGLHPSESLPDLLHELGDYSVRSSADARAICIALESIVGGSVARGRSWNSPLRAVATLFQDVESRDCLAFDILRDQGIPLLLQALQAGLKETDEDAADDLLFLLKILAMYGTAPGADAVLEAARRPLAPENFLWSVILGMFSPGHFEAMRVYRALATDLPSGFMGVALLDAANQYFLGGGEMRHPFDSEPGIARLAAWLSDPDPEHASYAVSATAAIPFLTSDAAADLLTLALAHRDGTVAMEGAWAAAKLGDPRGIPTLAECCLDVNRSLQARRYLEELERSDAIPPEAAAPEFGARAEFAAWLAHPNELGRAPDEVTVVDHRVLPWPPEFEPKPLWLLRYRVRASTELDEDDVGLGLVGSVTWCFFSTPLLHRPVEDVYALHCCWELEQAGLLNGEEVDSDSNEYDGLLSQWNGPAIRSARIEQVTEVSPEVRHPRRLVAIASGVLKDEPGWLVLDGPDSRWYAATSLPPEERADHVLSIHLGRRILGFAPCPDRGPWRTEKPARPPEEIAVAYERLLSEFEAESHAPSEAFAARYRVLNSHFEVYLESLATLRGEPRDQHLLQTYDRLFAAARTGEPSLGEDAFDLSSMIHHHFDDYVDAAVGSGRAEAVAALVDFLTPRWDHNLGYGMLGKAAFKAAQYDRALGFLVRLRDGLDDWHRCEEMDLLAEIHSRHGRHDEARALLIDCLRGVQAESREASGPDRKLYEEWFQNHRTTFLRLFPAHAEELVRLGIPESILRRRN